MRSLEDALIGEKVIITNLFAKDELRERLQSIGVTRDAKIEVLRKGPRNNLTVYRIRGAMIALRKEESTLIEIE